MAFRANMIVWEVWIFGTSWVDGAVGIFVFFVSVYDNVFGVYFYNRGSDEGGVDGDF